jgi:uncharacterized membrane protein YdbT with pleckstrin-like domain
MDEPETTIWEGHPSHVKDLGLHLLCLLFAPMILPLFLMLWRYLETRFHQYLITSERIRLTTGVLSRRMEEVELYRVKDTAIEQPFFLRIFKLANVVVETSDASTPRLVIPAIAGASELRENLRGCVEKMRRKRGVREVDYN